jgi:hypothetical protein
MRPINTPYGRGLKQGLTHPERQFILHAQPGRRGRLAACVTCRRGSSGRGLNARRNTYGDRTLARVAIEIKIDHRCDVEGDHLRKEQAADDSEAKRLPQLGTGAPARGDRHGAHRCTGTSRRSTFAVTTGTGGACLDVATSLLLGHDNHHDAAPMTMTPMTNAIITDRLGRVIKNRARVSAAARALPQA